nr:hypothetical protein [Tanacetum cinerariifolium]
VVPTNYDPKGERFLIASRFPTPPLAYCGVTHEPYQCQPKNHDYYHEENSCYNSNSFGFDHGQPLRYTVNHPIINAHNDLLTSQATLMEQMTQLTSMCEMLCQIVQKKREEKREGSNSLKDKIISEHPSHSAITPNEPVDSLIIGDEHLDAIPATKSDEFIKSCIENLVPKLSESEEFVSDNYDADIKSFSPSRIPLEDSDSHMEKIDLSFNPNDPMPPSIEEDDDDSKRDILILEELLDNYPFHSL